MQVGFRHFKWLNTPSAWQDMQHRRERRAALIKQHLDMMAGINSALSNALQNKISGSSSNAAQAALKRVQADGKAKSAEITKQIDSAQGVLDQTKAATGSSGGNPTVLDTVA
jgi:hypothetical protein